MRKDILTNEMVYHVFTKSIAGFTIFNNDSDFIRMTKLISYYQKDHPPMKFSVFYKLPKIQFDDINVQLLSRKYLVEIIAYCIMPTHIHLILKQATDGGVSIFMRNILNSYTRYFNTKHRRKGPLWEGRFKSVPVYTDEQILHLTRYIHLNPVTACLIDKPEKWIASSYKEYLLEINSSDRICQYEAIVNISPNSYRLFVENRIYYQRDLAKIKTMLIE